MEMGTAIDSLGYADGDDLAEGERPGRHQPERAEGSSPLSRDGILGAHAVGKKAFTKKL